MGWDSFGLPTERQAEREGIPPEQVTRRNVTTFKKQPDLVGLSYDRGREFATSDPSFYKWTQWVFLKLFEMGLAYEADVPVTAPARSSRAPRTTSATTSSRRSSARPSSKSSRAATSPQGIFPHCDGGSLSLNLWLTPTRFNEDPESGGLILFDAKRTALMSPAEARLNLTFSFDAPDTL